MLYTDEADIRRWLDEARINNYTFNDDLTVDVAGSVDLRSDRVGNRLTKLAYLPVQFNTVDGSFICSNNVLTSMLGCPHTVGIDFICSNNQIETFDHSPRTVGGNYLIKHNRIKSLVGVHEKISRIGGRIKISNNRFTEGGLGLLLLGALGVHWGGQDSAYQAPARAIAIIKSYLGKADKIFECQQELIEAGYEIAAKL